MSEVAPFICLHGIDGTGKTTAAAATVSLLDMMGFPTVNYDEIDTDNPFSAVKKRVTREVSPEGQMAFFLGSAIFHSDRISRLTSEGKIVVKARYVDDIIAQHSYLGVSNAENIARQFSFKQPDLRVVLTLDETERRSRIERRGAVDDRDKQVVEPGSRLYFFQNKLLQIAGKLVVSGKAIIIDTGSMSPQQVAELVISNLKARGLLA